MPARPRRRSAALVAVAGAASLSATVAMLSGVPAAADPPATPKLPSTQSVVVLLRDQLTSRPAVKGRMAGRVSAAQSAQRPVLDRIAVRSGRRLTNVRQYSLVNAFSASATAAQVADLAADPAVASVVPDVRVARAARESVGATGSGKASGAKAIAGPVCPTDPSKPLLEPEALTDTHTASDDPAAKTAQQLADGSGVRVAYIADGLDPDNPDFIRANGEHVIIDYKAFGTNGPDPAEGGEEAFGDVSAIAAQGRVSYDLSTFVNPAYPLPAGCNIRILGMAPGASVVALKTDLYTSSIIQAIDYAVSDAKVDVLNESFGLNSVPDTSARQAIQKFNDMAVRAGVTVTVSTGDAGTTGTTGSPGADPLVISAAADTNSRSYAQTGYAGARFFGNGTWVNDEISSLSSGGISQRGGVPDITAPGESGWAVCGGPECANFRGGLSGFLPFGGTSQSAPLTAGAAALVIDAYRSTHSGDSPSPALVKRLLTSTATDLGFPAEEQGAGLLNSRAAVEAALSYPGATGVPSGVGANIVLSKSALEISGKAGSTHTRTVTVRNVGTRKTTVRLSTRDLKTFATSEQTTQLDANSLPTFPYPTTGAPWAYKTVTFDVPAKTDRLAVAMIWQGAAKPVGNATVTPVVRLSVFQPDGAYVANSRPQGGPVSANYANLDVRKPAAGTWRAVLYTLAGASGYTGDVSLRTSAQRAVKAGSVNHPTFSLKPGQRRSVKVKVKLPVASGDATSAVVVSSTGGHRTSIAVTKRALISIKSGLGRFSGIITGGNARGGAPAQTLTYGFSVPKKTKDISVGVKLASDPGIQIEGILVDPHDQAISVGTNTISDVQSNPVDQGRTMQLNASAPVPGKWRLVVWVVPPVTGAEFTEKFSGTIRFNRSRVTTAGLPTSAATTLPQGVATTATVTVHNNGVAPINVQLDPRTTKAVVTPLSALADPTGDLPGPAGTVFLVPPATTALTASAVADVPVLVELQSGTAGIDEAGALPAPGTTSDISVARVGVHSGTVSSGLWFVVADNAGQTGDEGAAKGSVRMDLLARTPAIDTAVTSSTGDFWAAAFDVSADIGEPVRIEPGDAANIHVSITPTARVGTTVHGVLYVVTPPALEFGYPAFTTTGDTITALPYSYTVGAAPAPVAVAKTSAGR